MTSEGEKKGGRSSGRGAGRVDVIVDAFRKVDRRWRGGGKRVLKIMDIRTRANTSTRTYRHKTQKGSNCE